MIPGRSTLFLTVERPQRNGILPLDVKEDTLITKRFFRKKIIPLRSRFTHPRRAVLSTEFFWLSLFHNAATPLSTLLSLCEEFSTKLSPQEHQQILITVNHLQQVFTHSQRALLNRQLPLQNFIVTETLLTVTPLLEYLANLQGVEVTVWCDQIAWIRGYSSVLEQILLILWNNALEALHNAPVKKILTRLSIEEDEVQILIANTGPKIDPSQQESIFDVGFTAKSPHEHSGLGLPFVRYHMENTFQGNCELTEVPEYSCCFLLTFPKAS